MQLATWNWLQRDSGAVRNANEEVILCLLEVIPNEPSFENRNNWGVYPPHASRALGLGQGQDLPARPLLLERVGQCMLVDGRYSETVWVFRDVDNYNSKHSKARTDLFRCQRRLIEAQHWNGQFQEVIQLSEQLISPQGDELEESNPDFFKCQKFPCRSLP